MGLISFLRNRLRTKSAGSIGSGGRPMPIRRRGNSSVPKCRMVSASPFCPPADPPDLIRSRANSRLKSSQTSNRSHNGETKKVDDLPHRPAAFVHVRLRRGQQHLFGAERGLRQIGPRSGGGVCRRPAAWPTHRRRQIPHCAASVRTSGRDFQDPRQPSRDNLHATTFRTPVSVRPKSRVQGQKDEAGRPSTLDLEL